MEIKTEFDVGDDVFIIEDNEIQKGTVTAVKIDALVSDERPRDIDVLFYIRLGQDDIIERPESFVGDTPQKIANKLIRDWNDNCKIANKVIRDWNDNCKAEDGE